MLIVAHEVPVQKLTTAAVAKVSTGISSGARLPSSTCVRYWAVASWCVTSPSDHARVRITNPIVIARIPASHPSSASLSDRMRCVVASPIATRQPESDPHRIALNGSAAPNVSQIEAGPTAPRPSK